MDQHSNSRTWNVASVLAIALGLWLRLTGLEVHSLWFDEGGTLAVALADDPLEVLRVDRHPPLSFYAFRTWVAAFGESDSALRMLPALASSATLLLFAVWLRRLTDPITSCFAIAMFACSPYQVWFGHEVRMYAFVGLGTILALLGVEFSARRVVVGCVMVALGIAFAFGNHYLGAIIAPTVVALAWVAWKFDGCTWRRALALSIAAILGIAVWAPWLIEYLPSQAATGGAPKVELDFLDLVELAPRLFAIEFDAPPHEWRWLGYPFAALVWFALLVCVKRARTDRAARTTLLAALVPVLAALVVSRATHAGFQARYLNAAAPGVVAAVAVGCGALRIQALRSSLAGAVVIGLLAHTALLRSSNHREDYESACADLIEQWKRGDRVFSATGTIDVFAQGSPRHYLRDHPEIVASLLTQTELAERLQRGFAAGERLHVIYRDAAYATWQLDMIGARLALVERGPMRTRVQLSTWERRN